MFESKYSKYLTENKTRFAEDEEMTHSLSTVNQGCGVPLYAKGKTIYVDNMDNHSMTIGGTGCGKSRAVSKVLIKSIIENKESGIINDPSGELYEATAEEAGITHKVCVLNCRLPEFSDRWNPLYTIYQYYQSGQISKAQQAIDDFCVNLMSKTADKNDRYWDMVASTYVSKVMELCLMFSKEPSDFTLENILPLCNEKAEATITNLMSYIPNLSEAIKSGLSSVLDVCAERTKSCIYGVIHTGLDSLVKNDSLLKLFNSNDIDFRELAEKPMLIYVIYPDEKQCMNNIVNSFLTQAYTSLLDICDEREDHKLPIRINFVLDEFSNLTQIEHFDNRISESRKKNIRYHLFIQSMNQLSEKYGDKNAETILSNCTNWICFSSKEIKFLDTLSKLCGTTIDYNGRENPLISSSELQYLNKGDKGVEVLILRQCVRPYVTELPYYDYLYPDYKRAIMSERQRPKSNHTKLDSSGWLKLAKDYYDSFQANQVTEGTDDDLDDELEYDLNLELQKKFDELFGPIDSEED